MLLPLLSLLPGGGARDDEFDGFSCGCVGRRFAQTGFEGKLAGVPPGNFIGRLGILWVLELCGACSPFRVTISAVPGIDGGNAFGVVAVNPVIFSLPWP